MWSVSVPTSSKGSVADQVDIPGGAVRVAAAGLGRKAGEAGQGGEVERLDKVEKWRKWRGGEVEEGGEGGMRRRDLVERARVESGCKVTLKTAREVSATAKFQLLWQRPYRLAGQVCSRDISF